MSDKPTSSIQTALTESFNNGTMVNYFMQPEGMMLLGALVAMAVLAFAKGGGGKVKSSKGVLATGRFGSQKELNNAKKVSLTQLKERRRAPVTAWIGEPNNNPFGTDPIYFPDANRSTLVLGAANAGKTYSAINPLAMSAIDQGFPILQYDFKYPDQTSILAAYAKAKGYEVDILAPGYAESGVLNPITEFIDDETSGLYASQLAEVLNANFKKQGVSQSEDGYFGPSGSESMDHGRLWAVYLFCCL